jgi:transposase-like protein
MSPQIQDLDAPSCLSLTYCSRLDRENTRLRPANAAELVATVVEETLAYYDFPEENWRRIRTNNPLERILREIRRRTCIVGSFPDAQSTLNLAAARCAISRAPLGRPNAI